MSRSPRAVAASWLFVTVAGVVLWPPGAVYWESVAAVVGDAVTLGVVAGVAVALGAGFVWQTGVGLRAFAIGGGLAYASWMVGIEVTMTPDSPVHFIWYGGLLGCFLAGATLWRRRSRSVDHADRA
ncbi:hypothetical protein ACKVMT_01405 [Halobacteriales archaeon Cl-PHB]